MEKSCGCCKEQKQLSEFFCPPSDSRSAEIRSSAFCKKCHSDGKIKHGYGWYGDKYKSPEET